MFVQNAVAPQNVTYTSVSWERMMEGVRDLFLTGESLPNTQAQAEQLSPVAAAHRLLTGAMSIIPMSIYQKTETGRQPFSDESLDLVLKLRSNDRMGPALCRKILMSNAFWYGVSYGWIIRENGRPVEIIPLPSDTITIRLDKANGQYWYDCQLETGETRTFAPSELLIQFFETYDGIHGRGLLELAKETIGADGAAQKYGRKFYQNGARISGIVEVDADLKKEKRDAIKEQFSNFSALGKDGFKVAVLDRDYKYTPIGLNQKDAQFIENRNFSVAEISRFTGVPEFLLQAGKQSYNSNEQQQLGFLINTVAAHVTMWEQEWSWKLLGRRRMINEKLYIRGNVDAMLRGDFKTRAEGYGKMIEHGVRTPDECREKEELNPLPDGLGQIPLITKNLASLKDVAKGEKH